MASSAVNGYIGTKDTLQTRLQAELPGVLAGITGSQWQVVWGPVVWKVYPDISFTGPDNSWFVAHSPSVLFDDGTTHEVYVVAIAGTNEWSIHDWLAEDLEVGTKVDFSAWVEGGITQPPVAVSDTYPDGEYVAIGTATAAHLLLTEPSMSDAGRSLYEFLSGIRAPSSARFVFTGHSLGGALSPTMALALVNSGALQGDSVLVYPTAGPSPGNSNFADLFSQTFPESSNTRSHAEYAVWNTNIVNSLDIVPQAWCTKPAQSPAQNLGNIPPIYGPPIIPFVEDCVFFLSVKASKSGIVYMPLRSRIVSGGSPASTDGEVLRFLSEAKSNHTTFYSSLFGGVSRQKFVLVMDDGLEEKTEEEERIGYPVIGDLEWGHQHKVEAEIAVGAMLGEMLVSSKGIIVE